MACHIGKKLMIFLFFTFLVAEDIVLPTYPIMFSGQKYFDKSTLEEALSVENKSFYEFWKKDNPRIKKQLLPTLIETLESFYQSEGFYDAKIKMSIKNALVQVAVEENKPVKVSDINIQSDYPIKKFIILKEEDVFRAKAFVQSKNSIIKALLEDGYCSYDLDMKAYVDLKKHLVDLEIDLKKGEICTFGKLHTTGLKSIDEDVIRSRVRAVEGERFSPKLVQATSNALYKLGAFDSVLIDVDKKIYNVIPVEIEFNEIEKPYHLEVGAGYDTFVGPRVHAEITKYNFLNNAKKINLKAMWSQQQQLLTLNYFKPAFLNLYGYNLDLGANIGYSNLEFDGFQEEKAFARTYLQYENECLLLKMGMAFESINIKSLDNLDEGQELEQAVNEGDFLLTYPYVDVVYDARDSKLNPKYGYYLAGYSEIGLSREEDSNVYIKTQLEARFIHTFSELTLAVVGKVGVLDDESGKGLPESKYFFGGGSYSNRAYGYRQIGVIESPAEDTIYGASSMMNLSFEADYPIWGDLYGALFTDNTMLTEEAYDFKGEIISSAGIGVRYMTPIGPFKLDVGFNVDDPSIYGISFQVGQSF